MRAEADRAQNELFLDLMEWSAPVLTRMWCDAFLFRGSISRVLNKHKRTYSCEGGSMKT